MIYETSRLILRPFTENDLPEYQRIMGIPALGYWLDRPEGIPLEQSKNMLGICLKHWEDYGYGPFAVIHKEKEQLLGHCGLKYDERFDAPEILYAIDPDFWRQGLVTEASKKVLEIAVSEWGIKRVVSFTLPTNIASQTVMKKLGLAYVKNIIHADLDHVFFERELV